ncbi:KilA-N domain-containing protein [Nitrobacter sp. TKz-YC02]|uniref:KilA-N domain-containing protein n=1 Tax=Nitrobacter sp. TKz-YC02 TaxID=3398704 RepID=UPI003CF0C8C2
MTNKDNTPALIYNGEIIRDRAEMLSLTDMWKAAGGDKSRQPSEWLSSADAERFVGVLSEVLKPDNSRFEIVKTVRGGRSPGTWGHWQIAMAYAKYLSPEFHMWCNTVVRGHMVANGLKSQPIATLPADLVEIIHRTDGIARSSIHKITVLEKSFETMVQAVAAIAATIQPPGSGIYVSGRTAGEIWKASGFPPIKVTSWFSNRLVKMGCQIGDERRVPVGLSRAKLFDPDKAELWLRNGGRTMVEAKISERQGQRKLRLVGGEAPATAI